MPRKGTSGNIRAMAALNVFVIMMGVMSGFLTRGAREAQNETPGEPEEAAVAAGFVSSVEISESTLIVFECYLPDGCLAWRWEETPEDALIGMTRQSAERYFAGWDIVAFTPGEVTLARTIQ